MDAMLIVCPNCAVSYLIDLAAIVPAGDMMRCAHCNATWIAGEPECTTDVTAPADDAIAQVGSPLPPSVEAPSGFAAIFAAFRPFSGPAYVDPTVERAESMDDIEIEAPPAEYLEHDEPYLPVELEAEEPVAIDDAPPLLPPIDDATPEEAADGELDSEYFESFAARRRRLQARRKEKSAPSRWTAAILVLIACNVAMLGARKEVVRYLPQTASLFAAIGLPVNLRHLEFANVKISKDIQDGMLIVQGAVVSTAGKPIEVPRLRFAARNATGQEVYTWNALPSRSILGPGERSEFSSRLASPPPDASEVIVRFFNAQDAAAANTEPVERPWQKS